MEAWVILIILIAFIALTYIGRDLEKRLIKPHFDEGFETQIEGAYPESKGLIRWLDNKELYDSFYSGIYDELTQGSVRTQAEVGLALNEWTKQGEDLTTFEVLDAGCGTGIATVSLAKMNVKKVTGLDKSNAMLNRAKTKTLPQTTLTEEQAEKISWKNGDLTEPSASAGGEYTHALLLYFTIYYVPDKETVFRTLYYWIKPGGKLVVHVVNKHKFDPMLESSSPWLGFSLQKYSDTRITKSEVAFEKFKYIGEFDLQDPAAEFRETFRFNDGMVRRQRHSFQMENIDTIVGMARAAGWEYKGFIDLTPIAFEYAYHLHFKHP